MSEPTTGMLISGLIGTGIGLAFGTWMRRGLFRRIDDLVSLNRELYQANQRLAAELMDSEKKRRNLRDTIRGLGKAENPRTCEPWESENSPNLT